jgi:hypothetical protein
VAFDIDPRWCIIVAGDSKYRQMSRRGTVAVRSEAVKESKYGR